MKITPMAGDMTNPQAAVWVKNKNIECSGTEADFELYCRAQREKK